MPNWYRHKRTGEEVVIYAMKFGVEWNGIKYSPGDLMVLNTHNDGHRIDAEDMKDYQPIPMPDCPEPLAAPLFEW